MPASEVPTKIGYPIEVIISGPQSMDPLNHAVAWPGPYVWTYAKPGWFNRLEANVILKDGVVVSVNVELDDSRVYSTNAPPAPAAPNLASLLK
jgi:hypothetical protein